MDRRLENGFSVLELLVTVTVLAIVISVGVPSYVTFTQNNRMTALANDVIATIQVARSEAVKRRTTIAICGVADANVAEPDCGGGGSGQEGWMAFADANANGVRDGGEAVLSVHGAIHSKTALVTDQPFVGYAPTGFPQAIAGQPSAQMILVCDERGKAHTTSGPDGDESAARVIVLSGTGRPQIRRNLAFITALPLNCPAL